MNKKNRIEGERLAKYEVTRAQALEILTSLSRSFFSWQYLLLAVLGAGWAWVVATFSPSGLVVTAAAGGAGFFVALAAYREAVITRCRLEASLALAKANGDL
jgi:hypothetical protein